MEKIEYETIQLERLKVSLQRIISIKNLKIYFQTIVNDLEEQVKITFVKDYLCQKQDKTISFQTPKTWKDHFKISHRNNWFVKRWVRKHPIQFGRHIYRVDKNVVFPDKLIPNGLDYLNNFKIYQTREIEDIYNENRNR